MHLLPLSALSPARLVRQPQPVIREAALVVASPGARLVFPAPA
jgi:hypothetical protein